MRRLFIGLCLYLCVISPLGAQQGPNPPTVGPNTLQNAVTANANGSALNTQVAGYGFQAVTFVVSGTFSATVNFEATQDTSKWVSLSCYPTSGGAAVTTATSAGAWRCNLGGAFVQVRARISSYASGSVTVTGASSYQGLASNGQTPLDSIAGAIAAAGTGVLRADSGTASVVGAQWLDLSTCSDGTLVNCVASIGSTTVTTLGVTQVTTVATSATVTSNITLLFLGAGQLSINSGVTVTINGPIVATLMTIFTNSGTVMFGNGYIGDLYPQWWGATGQVSGNDTSAIKAALKAQGTSLGTLRLPMGIYILNPDSVVISSTNSSNPNARRIVGAGRNSTTLRIGSAGTVGVKLFDTGRLTLEDLAIDGNSNASTTVLLDSDNLPASTGLTLLNVDIFGGTTINFDIGPGLQGVNSPQVDEGTFINCRITGAPTTANVRVTSGNALLHKFHGGSISGAAPFNVIIAGGQAHFDNVDMSSATTADFSISNTSDVVQLTNVRSESAKLMVTTAGGSVNIAPIILQGISHNGGTTSVTHAATRLLVVQGGFFTGDINVTDPAAVSDYSPIFAAGHSITGTGRRGMVALNAAATAYLQLVHHAGTNDVIVIGDSSASRISTARIASVNNTAVVDLSAYLPSILNAASNGVLIVIDTNAYAAIYQLRGGANATVSISDPQSKYSTTHGNVGTNNIYYSSGYKLENQTGGTNIYAITYIGF